jgi:hypothetical protein
VYAVRISAAAYVAQVGDDEAFVMDRGVLLERSHDLLGAATARALAEDPTKAADEYEQAVRADWRRLREH